MKVVVIGGGLAGVTAAIALSEAGNDVTLLEARPRLGGATTSFSRDGLVVDTGQHVFLRCCTAYRELLDKLGVSGHAPLQPRFDVAVLTPGRGARLRRARLPGPLHMLPALARYPLLSLPERALVSRAALAFRRVDPSDPAADGVRLGDWLAAHGQDERARRALWDLFTVSSLNIAGDDASLALAATVVQTALLGAADAADIGVPSLPLGELHGEAALRLLSRLGARVRLGAKVAAVEAATPGFRVRLARPGAGDGDGDGDGDTEPGADAGAGDAITPDGFIDADGVVLAVPHEPAARLVPPGAVPDAAGWAGLGAAPIVNVHVVYDRKVTALPFAAAVDSPVQWVFDRTGISGMEVTADRGQYLAISLSAAGPYVDVPAAAIREEFVPALADLFPAARDARVTEFFVTRERRATFRQAPGSGRLRPAARTPLPGLVLAGAWTDTGWPDTMEGAVRSGLNAAIALRDSARLTGRGNSAPAGGTNPPVQEIENGSGPVRQAGPVKPVSKPSPEPDVNSSSSARGVPS
jgi:hydroxysqualene dehydroxylase